MADTTPYGFPDADEDSQDRFIEQHLAEAVTARSMMMGDKRIENQDPMKLQQLLDHREAKMRRRNRMFMLGTRHARRS